MPHLVLSVDNSSDPRSAPSYVPSVNPSRAPNKKQVGGIQEKKCTTLEQVKALENNIASGEIKVDEPYQLRGLYIIKLKCDICMLEINVKYSSVENHVSVDEPEVQQKVTCSQIITGSQIGNADGS